MQHPISKALPRLARWLDLPMTPLPGDDHMPRVQGRTFGPSERMVVSPGHEERGLFHMLWTGGPFFRSFIALATRPGLPSNRPLLPGLMRTV
jgi:penicillin amidase